MARVCSTGDFGSAERCTAGLAETPFTLAPAVGRLMADVREKLKASTASTEVKLDKTAAQPGKHSESPHVESRLSSEEVLRFLWNPDEVLALSASISAAAPPLVSTHPRR